MSTHVVFGLRLIRDADVIPGIICFSRLSELLPITCPMLTSLTSQIPRDSWTLPLHSAPSHSYASQSMTGLHLVSEELLTFQKLVSFFGDGPLRRFPFCRFPLTNHNPNPIPNPICDSNPKP